MQSKINKDIKKSNSQDFGDIAQSAQRPKKGKNEPGKLFESDEKPARKSQQPGQDRKVRFSEASNLTNTNKS